MNFFKFLGIRKTPVNSKREREEDILHLWEDDFLMLELLPQENVDFVKAETARINDFGQEHFDGNGFTAITVVGEKPFKTIDKLINISEVEKLMNGGTLNKIDRFHMQSVGVLEGEKAPIGFGTNSFAIVCERQKDLLKDIWITGHTENAEDEKKLIDALLLIGHTFGFIAVNWFRGEYYSLVEKNSVEEFVAAI